MENDKQVKPIRSLLFIIAVMGVLLLIMAIYPKNGIQMGGNTLNFPTLSEFFSADAAYADSLDRLRQDMQILFDSTELQHAMDSALILKKRDSLLAVRKSIQIPELARVDLNRFFEVLNQAKTRKVRILHYGDSQIEGDRITGHLRNELQTKFGGSGPGLFDVMQVAPKPSVSIEYSENWLRFSGFGWMDSTVHHNRYGPLMAFSRYLPMPDTTGLTDSVITQAWITIRPPATGYSKTRNYTSFKVFLSNLYDPVNYEIEANGTVLETGILPVGKDLITLQNRFESTPETLTLRFSGTESPDVYGLSLESNTGVIADNIPLRGSSGTLFAKHNLELLAQSYKQLSPDLIILEFGGNVIPYVEDEKECIEYGEWFKAQIKLLKRLNPNCAFLIIGPADTSVKIKTDYVTHPYLETVRDVMLQAAQETGCMYWDMYEVMGGKNSMPQWVNANPPLAAPDYIHFSRLGAQKMAEDFVNRLFGLYDRYRSLASKTPSQVIENQKNDARQVP